MDTVNQIELRWRMRERANPRQFRHAMSRRLGELARAAGVDIGFMFNEQASQPNGGAIATVRFYTGTARNGATAGIVAVGNETCARVASLITMIAEASRHIGLGNPEMRFNEVWIQRVEQPQLMRAQAVVLRDLRGDQAFYDHVRANPALIEPHLKAAVSKGLTRQAVAVGLPDPELTPDDVRVVSMAELGTQPVGTSGRGMTSSLTQAVVAIPVKLNGDWRIGGLLTYGNGRITPMANEMHYRDPARATPAYPVQRDLEEAA